MGENTKQTAVAVKGKSDIKSLLAGETFRKQVELCLPKHLSPERFCRIAITALTRVPKLADCTQASFFGSLLTLSQYGLEPDGRHAHLIPYGKECTLIIDYKGLVNLIYRNKDVDNVYASVVCENDSFVFDCGQIKEHKIDFRNKRGEMYAAYAIVRMKTGSVLADCMSREEIEAVRKRSRASGNGPWATDFNEMAKKTVLRRLSKLVPLPSEVAQAVNDDDDVPREIKRVRTIDVPPELITDGSNAQTEPEHNGLAENAGAAALADRLKKQAVPEPDSGLTQPEKDAIEAKERDEAEKERAKRDGTLL